MARTKQTARQNTGGKPLAMGKRKSYSEEEPSSREKRRQEGGGGVFF